ncbi:uncharacterized protein LOC113348525 [Papaver somniferum]|uniref:uncharacterized protein LOC113348525 n=1 Tax=Papaver somniferum TaxID=3469 RepID=UPI000E70574A|nr:uncharacterized protein LOC113348525 [Papaver somniferum]
MRNFNRFISRHELTDLPMIGATYTWTNNQVQCVRSRIDRILVSVDWECRFPNVTQQALVRPCSYHSPFALICDGVEGGSCPFRCEIFWYLHPDFFTFIQNTWNSFTVTGNSGFVMCKKFQLLKPLLKLWAKQEFGHMERRLEELEDIFVKLDVEEDLHGGLNEDQWNERLKAHQDYCNLTIAKAEKWRSRSRANHIALNEKNTKYFHKLASDRRRRNFIGAIKVDGVMTYKAEEVKKGIVDFFQNIFQNRATRTVSLELMHFNRISQDLRVGYNWMLTSLNVCLQSNFWVKTRHLVRMGLQLAFICFVGKFLTRIS